MANLLDIRRRIRSVKNTQQITKAMKTVSAAKLRRSQDRVFAARPYADELRTVLGNLASRIENLRHPLLEVRERETNPYRDRHSRPWFVRCVQHEHLPRSSDVHSRNALTTICS